MDASPTVSPRSREVRLGIVMYGGVSLAIYINGVAHELFRAVRGRGVYRLLKAVTDSDIVVDVISGTSAGGINGILLGYALCNEREFGDAAPLWREHGDLGALVRRPDTPVDKCSSVLDSEPGYQDKIEQGLKQMGAIREGDDEPSPIKELDLFVTGTDVDGVVRTVFDDAGQPIDVKDHRVVFQLKHRAGRRQPLNPDAPLTFRGAREHIVPALAKLARITSCFPVAFEPVKVVKDPEGEGPDGLLCRWGGLHRPTSRGERPETYFLDGGVLDNKPFSYTIGAIFSRAADVEVDRTLFYVEPDPETFERRGDGVTTAAPDGNRKTPNVLQAAVAALVTIPGYESISDDLKLIGIRNNKIEQYRRVVDALQTSDLPPWQALGEETRRLHTRARLIGLTERVVEGVLNTSGVRELMSQEQKERAARLITQFDALVSTVVRAEGPAESILEDFDVYFRQRRLHRIVYLIHDLRGRPDFDAERAPRYPDVLRAANRLLELYEIIRWAMEGLVDDAAFGRDDARRTWADVAGALGALLDDLSALAAHVPQHFEPDDAWLAADQLTRVCEGLGAARSRIAAEVNQGRRPAVTNEASSLLLRLDRVEGEIVALIADPNDPVRVAHDTFRSLDALVYPLELMSGVMEKDLIKTVRISPADAKKGFSDRQAKDKIAGDALHHFGGFLKASWRSNDILWGRLDGLCQLLERLLTRERLEKVSKDPALAERIRRRVATDLHPARLFPRSGPAVQERLATWLHRLFDADKQVQESARAALPTELPEMCALLVEAAQLETIHESLGDVITDALQDQARWNAFRVDASGDTPPYDAERWRFRSSRSGAADPLVAAVGAALTARRAVDSLAAADETPSRPSKTRLGHFFTEHYHVGSEGVATDIPPLVLLETGLKASVIARKCLLYALDGRAGFGRGAVARSIGALLGVFHGMVTLMRRAPAQGQAACWAIAASALTLLGVGIWQAFAKGVSGWGLAGWTVFIAAPVLALAGVGLVVRLRQKQEAPRPQGTSFPS